MGRVESRAVMTFAKNTYERAHILFQDIVDSAQDIVIITEAHQQGQRRLRQPPGCGSGRCQK